MKSVVGDLVQQSAAPRMKWSVEIPPRQSDAPLSSGALHPPIQSMADVSPAHSPVSSVANSRFHNTVNSPALSTGSSLAPRNSLGSPHGSPASPGNSPYHSSLQLQFAPLAFALAFYFDEPDFDFRTPTPTPTQDHRDDTPLFLDDGEGMATEVLAKSLGGPFTEQQIAEIREIVDAMNQQLEQKAKEWERPLESVMQIGNLGINTRERRSGGNPWNVFHHSYEKDSDPDQPHHEYVEKVIQPAYHSLILEHGGEDSAEWKKKAKELVEQHNASKAAQATAIALSPAAMGKVIKQTTKRWTNDLKWMATMNIHGFCTLFSGIPDEAASKHNAVFTGTPAMKAWLDESFPKDSTLLKMIHSHILVYQGEQQLQRDVRRKVPKTMHMMRKEISEELQNLLKPFVGHIPRVPWATLPRFLANNHLKMENWVTELDFANLMSLDVSVVRILQLADDTRLPDDTAIVVDRYNAILVTAGQAYESEGSGGPESHNGVNGVGSSATENAPPQNPTTYSQIQLPRAHLDPESEGLIRVGTGPEEEMESDEEPEEQGASTFDASLGGISGSASGPNPFAVPVNWENGLNTGVYNPVVPNDVPPSDFDALLAQYPDLGLGLNAINLMRFNMSFEISPSVPKSDHHLALAEVIFKDDKVFGSEWIANPTQLATSVSGRMDALKHDYKKYQSELNGTGGGVTTEQWEDDPDVANRIGKCLLCSLFSVFTNTLLSAEINKEFPWYDDLHAMWRDNPAYNPLVVTNVETKSSAKCVEELSAILHRKTHQGSPRHEEDEKDEDDENEDDETGGDQTLVGMGISDEYEDILDMPPMSLSHTTPPLPTLKPPTSINKKRKSSGPLLELPPTPKHSKCCSDIMDHWDEVSRCDEISAKACVDAVTMVKLAEIASKAKDCQADQELKEHHDLHKLEVKQEKLKMKMQLEMMRMQLQMSSGGQQVPPSKPPQPPAPSQFDGFSSSSNHSFPNSPDGRSFGSPYSLPEKDFSFDIGDHTVFDEIVHARYSQMYFSLYMVMSLNTGRGKYGAGDAFQLLWHLETSHLRIHAIKATLNSKDEVV
ncbi:hypothetical protein BS47DRAFT_1368971 [Hydnum rufescens UP504]|uniref:Uncharacterized protein n=1 Tax=Hydnum rufescens UP504 TaxID=1448309 RepID=A0A9P6AE56_9AGAM|nr:hypothetical protein BS47DRAFT_1368971 [Hydnum rufescens UP504]